MKVNKTQLPIIPAPQAAQHLGITAQTLHTWRKKGYILASQLPNGRYWVSVAEIDRIISTATTTDYVGGDR
jgi:predicted site-specific integrase-resolvase